MLSDALWHPLDAENYRDPSPLRHGLTESRSKARFPIDLPFTYRAGDRNGSSGSGRVVNISSTDVMVACRHQLKVGTPVELTIEWPARLDGRTPIHLVMAGRVVRFDISGFAVASCQHRFRLAGGVDLEKESELIAMRATANSLFCVPARCGTDAGELAPRANGPS